MENDMDSLADLEAGRPPEPQPDWVALEIEDKIQRQQKLPLQTLAPWEEEALLEAMGEL